MYLALTYCKIYPGLYTTNNLPMKLLSYKTTQQGECWIRSLSSGRWWLVARQTTTSSTFMGTPVKNWKQTPSRNRLAIMNILGGVNPGSSSCQKLSVGFAQLILAIDLITSNP